MEVRIRQIALVVKDLDWSTKVLSAALGTEPSFRDPHMVGAFGLFNCLMPVGDAFLELVSPVPGAWEQGSTATRLLSKKGDSGYMVILQVNDIEGLTQSMVAAGAEPVMLSGMSCANPQGSGGDIETFGWNDRYGTWDAEQLVDSLRSFKSREAAQLSIGLQWPPQQLGTLLETDQTVPPGSWLNAGNGHHTTGSGLEYDSVTLAVRDPKAVAELWSTGLRKPLVGESAVQLDGCTVHFVPMSDSLARGRAGLVAVSMWAPRTACFDLCGVTWTLKSRKSKL